MSGKNKKLWTIVGAGVVVFLIILVVSIAAAARPNVAEDAAASINVSADALVFPKAGAVLRCDRTFDSSTIAGPFDGTTSVEIVAKETGEEYEDSNLWLKVTDLNNTFGWIPAGEVLYVDGSVPTKTRLFFDFWLDDDSSLCGTLIEEPALEVLPTEAPTQAPVPEAEVQKARFLITSVLPEKVKEGEEIEVILKVEPAKGTKIDDYKINVFAPDKTTLLIPSVVSGKPFKMATPKGEVGDGIDVGWVVVTYELNPALNPEPAMIHEDLEAIEHIVQEQQVGCPARVEINPPNNAFLNKDDKKVYSFSYKLEENRSYEVVVPCGSTATMAFGNAVINGKTFAATEVEGNIVYSTCDEPGGCIYVIEAFTAGHVDVTIAYPAMEKAAETVFNAVSNMFNPSNCGGSGCIRAFLTDMDQSEATITFDDKPLKETFVVNDFAIQPTVGSVIGEPSSQTISVNGQPVGQLYSLDTTATQYVGVPEGHDGFVTGVYFDCPEGCIVYNQVVKAGEKAIVYGNVGDGSTPSDLNWTVAVQSDKPETVKVYFIYNDNVDNYVTGTTVHKFNFQGLMK